MVGGNRPWESEYTVEDTTIVAETPELRVLTITLGEGESIPWHYHSNVTDSFFCLEGDLVVETRAPRDKFALRAGARCEVPPRRAHHALNGGAGRCRFLLVQGTGEYDFVKVGGAPADAASREA